jgi:MSHA biogenesis protein MshJ
MKFLHILRQWFGEISTRERILFVFVICVTLGVTANFFILDPLAKRNRELAQQIELDRKDLAGLKVANQTVEQRQIASQTAEQLEAEQLRARIRAAEAPLKKVLSSAGPEDLLRAGLTRGKGLALKSYKSLPVESFFDSGVPAPGKPATPAAASLMVYKHGAEITVRGNYLDLSSYLRSQRETQAGLFWSSVKLEVFDYPDANLTATVYRLSDQKVLQVQ